jgi:arylsulfatase A
MNERLHISAGLSVMWRFRLCTVALSNNLSQADFSYNNGTAKSPFIKAWTESDGTVTMQDFHSGGTVCSPTRATILTGRNHYRDCVNYV